MVSKCDPPFPVLVTISLKQWKKGMFLEVITLCNIPFKEMKYQLSKFNKTKLYGLQDSSVSTLQT
jgi:hypothetical protein